jgi:hypothetical protein
MGKKIFFQGEKKRAKAKKKNWLLKIMNKRLKLKKKKIEFFSWKFFKIILSSPRIILKKFSRKRSLQEIGGKYNFFLGDKVASFSSKRSLKENCGKITFIYLGPFLKTLNCCLF